MTGANNIIIHLKADKMSSSFNLHNGANIITVEVKTDNGVIHVIDKALLPK